MSEEFGGALPSAIEAEIARQPVGFLEQILEYRRYADAKREVEASLKDQTDRRRRILATTMGALAEQIRIARGAEAALALTNG